MSLDVYLSIMPVGALRALASLVLVVGLLGFLLGTSVYQGVRRRRGVARRVLVLGTSPLVCWIVGEIGRRRDLGWVVVDVVEDAEKLDVALEKTRPDRIVVGLRG